MAHSLINWYILIKKYDFLTLDSPAILVARDMETCCLILLLPALWWCNRLSLILFPINSPLAYCKSLEFLPANPTATCSWPAAERENRQSADTAICLENGGENWNVKEVISCREGERFKFLQRRRVAYMEFSRLVPRYPKSIASTNFLFVYFWRNNVFPKNHSSFCSRNILRLAGATCRFSSARSQAWIYLFFYFYKLKIILKCLRI